MSPVTGWWKLLSWTQNYDDGRKVAPFGEGVVGRLTYNDAGDFAVLISRPDRERFVTGGQWTAEDREKASSYDGMLAYYGRYELSGTTMAHHVEASLYPNWVGQVQLRTATITKDILKLSGRLEESTTEARTAELIWQRMPG